MINYEKGIKFKCQGSSKCCVSRGTYGFVYLSEKDLKKISYFLKIKTEIFKKKFCQYTNKFLHLKEVNKNGNCIFLKEKKCTIYNARPTQCRTWPFWAENMNSKKWNQDIIKFCPGIGKGQFISKKKIDKLLKDDLENEKLL